ncbi:hypothetical protein NPIL_371461, partial [Nephila pilipes]
MMYFIRHLQHPVSFHLCPQIRSPWPSCRFKDNYGVADVPMHKEKVNKEINMLFRNPTQRNE